MRCIKLVDYQIKRFGKSKPFQKEWNMARKIIAALTPLIVLLTGVLLVYAGVHFGGSTSYGFGSLKANVNIFGVGVGDNVTVTLHATGSNLIAMCQYHGGKSAPRQES